MDARPIVVEYDDSPEARAALSWALDEGERSSLPVELVHGFGWHLSAPWLGGSPKTKARAEIKAMLANAAADARNTHPGLAVSTKVMDGPAQACIREASTDAAMIVLGRRGARGFVQSRIGSTAMSVSTHAHCTVLVVPAATGEASSDVVVGFDGSPCSHVALRFAFEKAAACRAPLRVIQTWTPPPTRYYLETVARNIHDDLDDLVAGWGQKYPQVSTSTSVLIGGAAEHLVAASLSARLVVVGSRGRGGLSRTLRGSVGQQLIRHAQSPVAIVREVPAAAMVLAEGRQAQA